MKSINDIINEKNELMKRINKEIIFNIKFEKKIYDIKINNNLKIINLKLIIEEEINILIEDQILLFNGKELKNNENINNFNFDMETILILILKKNLKNDNNNNENNNKLFYNIKKQLFDIEINEKKETIIIKNLLKLTKLKDFKIIERIGSKSNDKSNLYLFII
jgi:hypothetical protein